MDLSKIIEAAREAALSEIQKYGTPKIEHFELSNTMGQNIAEQLDADKNIVMLGTILMDFKLGECLKEKRIDEHIQRSAKEAYELLMRFSVPDGVVRRVINCIEAHHGTREYACKEAEICANADCYRFLSPKGIFAYFILLGSRSQNLQESLIQVEHKMDEKFKTLSLDACKQELEPYYHQFKKLLDDSRQ